MTSLFEALLDSLQRTSEYNHDDTVAPAAILWPDANREWTPLVPRLRSALPHFLTLGDYDPAQRTGPAIWLRCVLAGKISAVTLPGGSVPILYLPGVGRATLRDAEECPKELKAIF